MSANTAIVVAPSGQLNLMGRALAVAELLDHSVEKVSVFTPDTGPLWPPSARWQIDLRRGGNAAGAFTDIDPEAVGWIFLVKPLADGYRAARQLREAFPEASLILDVDDDDEALSREFIAGSPLNRLRLALSGTRRQLLPGRIDRTRRRLIEEADAFTVATRAVASSCEVPASETLRVIHPRTTAPDSRRRAAGTGEEIHLGFFGTVRPHKGSNVMASLLDADPEFHLHLFAGFDPAGFERVRGRIVEHPPDEPQVNQFEGVDAILLPQGRSPAGEVQLPAKLIDAMKFGAPVFSTPTAAITEVAGDTLHYIEDWEVPEQAAATIREVLSGGGEPGLGARQLFEKELSIEAMVPAVREFLADQRRRSAARASASK